MLAQYGVVKSNVLPWFNSHVKSYFNQEVPELVTVVQGMLEQHKGPLEIEQVISDAFGDKDAQSTG